MAAARPVVAAVSERSEAARQIRAAQCGVIVSPEDPASLLQGVLMLRQDMNMRLELGANGRRYALAHFTKCSVLQKYALFFDQWSSKIEDIRSREKDTYLTVGSTRK